MGFFPLLFPRQSYVFLSHRPQAVCEVLTELQAVSLEALNGRENIIKLETPKTRQKVSNAVSGQLVALPYLLRH